MQRVNTGQIQMVTPQKVMHPVGMVQQPLRFQTPAQTVRAANPTLRATRPRTPATPRIRTPVNVRPPINAGQQMTSTPVMNQRPRLTLTRLTTPNQVNQIQPIISLGTPKTVVNITTPPRGPIVRTPTQVYQKASPVQQQTHVQASPSPSTSNSSIATEDLEDSIQAARITKQIPSPNYAIVQPTLQQQINEANDNHIVTLQSGTQMSVAEYKQRQQQVSQTAKNLPGIKPMQRAAVPNRQTRFAAPNVVRAQRPVLVR